MTKLFKEWTKRELDVKESIRFLKSLGYDLSPTAKNADGTIKWTIESIMSEAETMIDIIATDDNAEYIIVDDNGPFAVKKSAIKETVTTPTTINNNIKEVITMATTVKKMMKELVNKGYIEKNQKLSDSEIKKLYNQLCNDEQETAEPLTLKAQLILEYPQLRTVIEDTFDYRIEYIDSAEKMGDVLTLSGWDAGTPCSIGINIITGSIEWDHNEERDAYEEKEESIMMNSTMDMTKDELRKELEKYGVKLSNTKFNKAKKEALIYMLNGAMIDYAKINHYKETNVEKEESTMRILTTADMTKEQLRAELEKYGVKLSNTKFNKTKKGELEYMLNGAEIDYAKINHYEESVSVGDLPTTHDNINHKIAMDDVWNIENANKVVHDIMTMASKNKFVDYISTYMVRSAIRMTLFGKYSKEKVVDSSGKVTYYENIFTPEEESLTDEFMKKFSDKYLIQYKDDGKGYHINSLLMSWYYKKVVYRFKSKTQMVDYVLDYNAKTLTRKGTNQSWPLDDAAFKKLDDQCFFLYVCKNQ